MRTKVMLAFSNRLFSEGIAALLEDDETMEICRFLEAGTPCRSEYLEQSDVILTDFASLELSFPDLDFSKRYGFILFDTDCGRENIASAIMSKNISGVLLGNATLTVLKKAIRSVAGGEVWLDKSTVKDILCGFSGIKKDLLSDKESEVVALAGKGLRNKEIAGKLKISELTVKTHLNRIFRKLSITKRSELINYSIKKSTLRNTLYKKRGQP